MHFFANSAALALLLVDLFACFEAATAQYPDIVQLTEISHIVLPDTIVPSGAALSESGAVLVWGSDLAGVVYVDDTSMRAIGERLVLSTVGAAFVDNDLFVEIVDGYNGQVVRYSVSGTFVEATPFNLPIDVLSAARGAKYWYVAGMNAQGTYDIYEVASSSSRLVARLAASEADAGALPSAHVSAGGGDDVLVTFLHNPHTVYRVPVNGGGRQQRFDGPNLDLGESFVSLPTLPLHNGYIQTIADLLGDQRFLVWYDDEGHARHTKRISSPIGLFGVDSRGQRVVGARNVGRIEIVIYQVETRTQGI